MVKKQRLTSQQPVTQDSNNNQVYPKGCQKQTAPRYCQHPIRWAFTPQALARWRHLSTHRIKQACYSFVDPGRMKG